MRMAIWSPEIAAEVDLDEISNFRLLFFGLFTRPLFTISTAQNTLLPAIQFIFQQ